LCCTRGELNEICVFAIDLQQLIGLIQLIKSNKNASKSAAAWVHFPDP